MTEFYLAAIRAKQPHGPYFLSGYSFGGIVALELARRLQAEGETVALLAFIDSFTHPRTFATSARRIVQLRVTLNAFRTLPFHQACAFLFSRLKGRRAANDIAVLLAKFRMAKDSEALRKAYDAGIRALMDYRPSRYDGDIVFFRPENSIFPVAPARVWGPVVRRLVLHTVPGDHESMLRDYAGDLAAAFSRVLGAAAKGG